MNFWRGVFSDGDTPSFSRVGTGALVSAAIVWVSRIVWRTDHLPDFTGLALFMGTLYGLNRVTTAFGKQQLPTSPGATDAAPNP